METLAKYFSIINVLNSLSISETGIFLMAYAAMKGDVGLLNNKKEFCSLFNIKLHTYNNLIYMLLAKGVLVREEKKKIGLNKQLHIENSPIVVQIHIENEAS